MHQSSLEAVNPTLDDLRPTDANEAASTVGPINRSFSVVAGSALFLTGLRRRSLPLIAGGTALLYRGATGYWPFYDVIESASGRELESGLYFEETITVQKPVEEVFSLWRQIENLPRFMSHLEAVTRVNGQQSHWIARIPAPLRLEWDATIVEEQENRKIAWQSLPGSNVHHAGGVFFHSVPARKATEVKVIFSCRPPAGRIGQAVAQLFANLTEHQIREDLRGFKAFLETGERPTTAGQPSGRS
jgi:uncharacterized membrane protein